MGAFNNKTLRINCKNLTKELEKQFFECYGIYRDEFDFLSEEVEIDELDNIYAIISVAFGDAYLCYEESEGHTVSDWYAGYEVSYNYNNSGKKITKSYNYCYGDNTVDGINCWNLLKDEIEATAKKKNIKIVWRAEDSNIYPNDEDEEFFTLAEKVLEKKGGLEGLSTIEESNLIKKILVDQEKVREIINEAKSNDFTKLVEILESKLVSGGNYPDFIFKSIKKQKQPSASINVSNCDDIIDCLNNNQKINFKKLDEKFRDNKELVIKFIEADPELVGKDILKNASDRLKDDEDVVSLAVMNHRTGFQYASDRLKNDKHFVIETTKKISSYLEDKYKEKKDLYDIKNIKYYIISNILKNVSEDIKNNKEVLLNILKVSPLSFENAGKEIKNDRKFIIEAIKIDSTIFNLTTSKFRNDKEIAMTALNNTENVDHWLYTSLGDKIRNDREISLLIIKKTGHLLEYFPNEFKNDSEFNELAMQSGYPLSIASKELRNNKEVVLKSLENQYGENLKYVSNRLKDDKEVVIKAVQNDSSNGEAIQYASNRLKDDKEVILEAIKVSGYALKHASDRLKNDKEVVLNALRGKSGNAKYYIGNLIKDDPDIKNILDEI